MSANVTIPAAAEELNMTKQALYTAIRKGQIAARLVPFTEERLVIPVSELNRLKKEKGIRTKKPKKAA
jgi:hypothetical protein